MVPCLCTSICLRSPLIKHVWIGALCCVQASVSTRVSNTFCGSWSVYIISLQPFVSNTFGFGFSFVYPPRRFYYGPELRISCQTSWNKGKLFGMDDVALVSTKRSMSHEKLSFIVRTMWATSLEGAWFKLAAIDLLTVSGLWTKFSKWFHLRHSGQRAPIQFYIDVNFAEFQFGVLATIAGLATSHYVDDVLAVDRNNFLALACLACLSSLLWLGCSRRKKSSSVTSSSRSHFGSSPLSQTRLILVSYLCTSISLLPCVSNTFGLWVLVCVQVSVLSQNGYGRYCLRGSDVNFVFLHVMSGLDHEGGDGHKHGCLEALAITLSLRWSLQESCNEWISLFCFLHRVDVLSGNSSMSTIQTPGFLCLICHAQ